jgi:hypothetical protein
MKNASTIKVYKDSLAVGIDVSKADLAVVGITMKEISRGQALHLTKC